MADLETPHMPNGYADTPHGHAMAAADDREARKICGKHLSSRSDFLEAIEAEFGREEADAALEAAMKSMEGVPGMQQDARAADAVQEFYERLVAERDADASPSP